MRMILACALTGALAVALGCFADETPAGSQTAAGPETGWERMVLHSRQWTGFTNLIIERDGRCAIIKGDTSAVVSSASGTLESKEIEVLQESIAKARVPSLLPNYELVNKDQPAELDQFEFRLVTKEKTYRTAGALAASPAALQMLCSQAVAAAGKASKPVSQIAKSYVRAVPLDEQLGPFAAGSSAATLVAKMRKDGMTVPTVSQEKLQETPCFSAAMKMPGVLTPCAGTEDVRRLIPNDGEAEIAGGFWWIEVYTASQK